MSLPRTTADRVLALVRSSGRRFDARNLATAAHRVGKFGGRRLRSDGRLEELGRLCRRKVRSFPAHSLAVAVWGFAKAGLADLELFAAFAGAAKERIDSFNSLNMSNTVWAFATAGVVDEELFGTVAAQFARTIRRCNPLAMAETAWAFATAGVADTRLFDAIAAEVGARPENVRPQELATLLYAFAVVGWPRRDIFVRVASHLQQFDVRQLPPTKQALLALAALYARLRGWEDDDDDLHLFSRLSSSFPVAVRSGYYLRRAPFRTRVSATLRELGWEHAVDHATPEGLSPSLADAKSKRAVQVDGPSSFLRDASTGDYVLDGPTRFKSRLLQRLGWKVAHLAYFEWQSSKFESERHALMAVKLAEVGVVDLAPDAVPRWILHDLL